MTKLSLLLKAFSLNLVALALAITLARAQTEAENPGSVHAESLDQGQTNGVIHPLPPLYAWVTNQDGTVTVATNQLVTVAPRVELHPQIRVHEKGATAVGGSLLVEFEGDINTTNSIQIASTQGKILLLHAIALAASDQYGKRVWLAAVTNAQGYVLAGDPARVVYTNSFDNIKADIVYQYNIGSISQDIYLREPIVLPADQGLDPASTRFEVWSEAFAAPEPRTTARTVSLVPSATGNHPNQPANPAKQILDQDLDFGNLAMVQSRAFCVHPGADGAATDNWIMAKQW